MPEKGLGSAASGRDSGTNSPEPFACFDPVTCSWKTSQLSLFGGLTPFSARWPRSGTMRNGTCFRLPPLAPRTSGKGSSLWPTPRAKTGAFPVCLRSGGHRSNLEEVVAARFCPTPEPPSGGETPLMYLNPEWVEWLQGFPMGWTDLEDSATP